MSLPEIIKKLRLIDIKAHFNLVNIQITINKPMINTSDSLTPKQFEEVKEKSLETVGEIETLAGSIILERERKNSELPQPLKEAVAKAVVTGTILTNLSTLRQKISKDLIKLNPNTDVSLLIRCDKCGKFFNSGIGGKLRGLASSTFINNIHQCQYCGNKQLAKDNSDYFVLLEKV